MMRLGSVRAGLVAGCMVGVASLGLSAPVQAVVAAPTAYVVEGPGVYTLINNSSFQVYRFAVSNPAANSQSSAFTTQTGWTAIVCSGSCPGAIQNGFLYFDNGLASDIGPGQSSSAFHFSAAPASTFQIYLRDATGGSQQIFSGAAVPAPSVPEPATWALMMVGLGAAGTMMRRRRAGTSVVSA